jgi:hypothetical protein
VESSCECGNETSGSIKCWNYRVATQLQDSRLLLSSIEIVSSEFDEILLVTKISVRSRNNELFT